MRAVKRIEIITGAMGIDRIEEILSEFGVEGHLIIREVVGKGDRGGAASDALNGESEQRVVTTTCPQKQAGALIAPLEDFVKRYGGACIVYDAMRIDA
jgi:nitrogen regulatory protein PII